MSKWKFPRQWDKMPIWAKEIYCSVMSVDMEGNKIPRVPSVSGFRKITVEQFLKRIAVHKKYGIWVDYDDLDKYSID